MTKPLEIKDLRISIRDKIIVDGFTVELEAGGLYALTGPSGSGKSTLLKTIAGVIPGLYSFFKVEGEVKVYGVNPLEARSKGLVSYIPQDPTAYFVGSTIREELDLLGDCNCSLISDILGDLSRRIHELSDGQLYRLLLTTSILSGARLLLIDEPTSHIDPWILPNVLETVAGYCRIHNAAAIIVDHRIEILEKYAVKVIRLEDPVEQGNENSRIPRTRENRINAASKSGSCEYTVIASSLEYYYDRGKHVLKNVSLTAKPGDILVIIGKNGSGKTTLIKLLAGLLKPSKGFIRTSKPLFLVPQSPIYWFSQNTVREEVEFYARIWGFKDDIEDVMEIFNLKKLEQQNPVSLSIGEARLLSLALAYISKARVLLLDEPTLGLDYKYKRLLMYLLEEFALNGASIIIATHDLELARSFKNTHLLEDGYLKVVDDGFKVPLIEDS